LKRLFDRLLTVTASHSLYGDGRHTGIHTAPLL
jgi:hypothetical protein